MIKTDEVIMNNDHQSVAFANDFTILAKTQKELRKITRRVIKDGE